jgi:hypothetical protein
MMHTFDFAAFGSAATSLVGQRQPALGPGSPDLAAKPALDALTVKHLFGGKAVRDTDMARCCIAALWLHHDFLEESHKISQEISTAEGIYWHAIMHRREPDPGNSKYWFRRVGAHPILDQLAKELRESQFYDYTSPFDFIDFCERVRGTGSEEEFVARGVQLLEWVLLFEHCGKQAI